MVSLELLLRIEGHTETVAYSQMAVVPRIGERITIFKNRMPIQWRVVDICYPLREETSKFPKFLGMVYIFVEPVKV